MQREFVKSHVKTNRNDEATPEMICETVSRRGQPAAVGFNLVALT
jgi:hypothetical protein